MRKRIKEEQKKERKPSDFASNSKPRTLLPVAVWHFLVTTMVYWILCLVYGMNSICYVLSFCFKVFRKWMVIAWYNFSSSFIV